MLALFELNHSFLGDLYRRVQFSVLNHDVLITLFIAMGDGIQLMVFDVRGNLHETRHGIFPFW